jgi:hypothetical protein
VLSRADVIWWSLPIRHDVLTRVCPADDTELPAP